MKYKLAEKFLSIQGEGVLAGTRMFFIRFAGCTVSSCPLHPHNSGLCDTDWSPKSVVTDVEALACEAHDAVGDNGWVSVTGGEPSDQPEFLEELIRQLHYKNLNVNLQTSGFRPVDLGVDWLTVSPKGSPVSLLHDVGDELKLVYTGQTDKELAEWVNVTHFEHYFLMPLWTGGSCNATETVAAIHRVNSLGQPWKITLQQHKYMGVR